MTDAARNAYVLIRRRMAGSRAELSREMHVSRPTASVLVDSLLQEGRIRETGTGPSTGGKAPTLLEAVPEQGCMIGLDLGYASKVSGVLLDGRGNVVRQREQACDSGSMDALESECAALISNLAKGKTPAGLGVALSGVVEPGSGRVLKSVNPLFCRYDMKNIFGRLCGLPVLVENRARMAAVSEAFGGAADRVRDFALISLGRSIGAAFWINGAPWSGPKGAAGEIRNLQLQCGMRFEEGLSPTAAEAETPGTLLERTADGLGQLREVMDMDLLVLAGRFSDWGKDFPSLLERKLAERQEPCRVLLSRFGRFSAARGVAFRCGEVI